MDAFTRTDSSIEHTEQLRILARTTAPLVITISKQVVENGDIEHVVARLTVLSNNIRFVAAFADRMRISFTGYEDDPRPIHQIPECVSFFRRVNTRWSYWFNFIAKSPEQFGVLFQLLCDVDVGRAANITPYSYFKDMTSVRQAWFSMFVEMNRLYEKHGMTTIHLSLMSTKVVNAFNRLIDN